MLWLTLHFFFFWPLSGAPSGANESSVAECNKYSATGTRTRVARVRAEYPNQLDYSGSCSMPSPQATSLSPTPTQRRARFTDGVRQTHEHCQRRRMARFAGASAHPRRLRYRWPPFGWLAVWLFEKLRRLAFGRPSGWPPAAPCARTSHALRQPLTAR